MRALSSLDAGPNTTISMPILVPGQSGFHICLRGRDRADAHSHWFTPTSVKLLHVRNGRIYGKVSCHLSKPESSDPKHQACEHGLGMQTAASSRRQGTQWKGFQDSMTVIQACEPEDIHWSQDLLQCNGERKYTARDIALGLISVFGWRVEVHDKGDVGVVDEIVHIGRVGVDIDIDQPYEYILKVVGKNHSGTVDEARSSTLSPRSSTSEMQILIPIVDEFIEHIDTKRRCLLLKPPVGLLELASRPEAIKKLYPEIQHFCKRHLSLLEERFSDPGNKKIRCNGSINMQEIICSYMPTRDQLLQFGRADLVRRIRAAGGFLYVAHELGLKTTRRPNGFWDDLEKLDFEIECFILENWVKRVHERTGITYFENIVTKEIKVEKPSHNPKICDASIRAMPQQKQLSAAGRWDLHHAIIWNGGYKEVARALGRTLIRITKKIYEKQADMLDMVIKDQLTAINSITTKSYKG